MAEMRASPVVNPRLKRIAEVLADLQGPMGQIIPFTDVNPFKVLMPKASTFENLAYGNSPLVMPTGVTNRRLPIVKTGREGELTDIADVALMASGLPMASRGVARGANYLGDVLTQAVTRNPQATSMRALDEIARMSPVPQIAPKPPQMPMTPPKSDIGFYSQLEAATIPLQNKGTGDQYLAQIQKSAGVKPEEIQWTGLNEFLTGKPSVTKQEIQDYLQANRVDVREVRLGGATSPYPYRTADEWQGAINRAESAGDWDEAANINQAWEAFEGYGPAGMTKFSQYTLPGGENYREILLTLPRKTVQAEPLDVSGFSVRTTENAMFPYTGQRDIEVLDSAGNVVSRRSGFRGTDDEAIQNYAGTVTAQAQKADESLLNYRSSHFDQPNILAHMRVNDRVVDGKKTLFIEEIQSDWHQAGRKKGYATGAEEKAYVDYLKDLEVRAKNDIVSNFISNGATPERAEILANNLVKGLADDPRKLAAYFGEESKQMELHQARLAARGGVPDAPFKTSWHELTLKRAIQEASEKGYDQIAFTTGKTQAERYDLSKQISQVKYNPPGSEQANKYGTVLKAYDKTGNEVINKSVTPEELPDYLGKEIAERLLKSDESYTGVRSLSGIDLQVGGEGMKGFYDNILPKSLEKLGKKFDAKVGKTEMDGVEVWQMDITPKMRESVTTKGQPLFAIPTVGAAALGASMYDQDPLEQFLNYQ